MTTRITTNRDLETETRISFTAEGDPDQVERLRMFIKAGEGQMRRWCGASGWGRVRRKGAVLAVTLESVRDEADAVIAVLIERFRTLNFLYGYATRTTKWDFSYRDGRYVEEYQDAAGDVWVGCPGRYERALYDDEDEFEPLVIAKNGEVAILDPYATV